MYRREYASAQARLAELEAKWPDALATAKAMQSYYLTVSALRDKLTGALNRADAQLETARRAHENAAAEAFLAGKSNPSDGPLVATLTATVAGLRRKLDEEIDAGARSRLTDAESALATLDGQIAGMRNYFKKRPRPDRISWDNGTIHVGSDAATGRVWTDGTNNVATRVDG